MVACTEELKEKGVKGDAGWEGNVVDPKTEFLNFGGSSPALLGVPNGDQNVVFPGVGLNFGGFSPAPTSLSFHLFLWYNMNFDRSSPAPWRI